jgi:hypothetical protein
MFQATVTRRHSPRTQSSPRSRNCRKPSTDLIMPNTGSGTCLRSTRSFLPSWVLSRCATASIGVGFSGAVGAAAKPTMPDDAARLACPYQDCVARPQPAWHCHRLSVWHRRALVTCMHHAASDLQALADDPNSVSFASRAPSQPAVCSPAAAGGMLRQTGLVSSPPSASWVRDFRGCDLWPTWFSRLFRWSSCSTPSLLRNPYRPCRDRRPGASTGPSSPASRPPSPRW